MNTERWTQIETLFHEALEVEPVRRVSWLHARCGTDRELLEELKSLLEHQKPAEDELGRLVQVAAESLAPEMARNAGPGIGDQIGPYHLIKEIGRGGMGVVFLAARTDPQFFQTVAIKVLKREFGASVLASRFLRERQILATLNHPNIARVLDGGSTEAGTPYLVMEFISGKPITAYATEKHLTIEDKIRLFQRVCEAVQHAHRNLVIHRDLKPGNVLVGENGEPKLLDFGIAKLLGPEMLPMELPPTETQWRLMTPDYASPEQLRGESLTTATDVFSLGILLYELLAGERPFRFQTGDPFEWVETICSREPERPSASAKLSIRERRQMEGDLDQIVLKALRKEPERRYGSAARLADDLDRYLNGEPVDAHRSTVSYRTIRWMQRHRLMLAMVLLVCMAMAGGLATTIWQARRAERRFHQLHGFAYAVVFDLDERIRQLPGSTEARGALIRTSLRYLDNLSREAAGDPALITGLAQAYRKIGDVQGSPYQPNLGNPEAAERSYRKALELAGWLAAESPRDMDVQLELVRSRYALGRLLAHAGGIDEAAKLYQEGWQLAQALAREHAHDARVTELRTQGAMFLGDTDMFTGQPEAALERYRFAVRLLETAEATNPETMREISRVYARLADAKAATGSLRDAVLHYERSIEIREMLARRFPDEDEYQRDLFSAYISVGSILGAPRVLSLHDKAAAKKWFVKALVIAENLSDDDPASTRAKVDLAFGRAHMAETLPPSQRSSALLMMRDAVQLFDEIVAAAPTNVGYRHWQARRYVGLSRLLRQDGDLPGALEAMERALAIREQVRVDDPARADNRVELATAACGVVELMTEAKDVRLAQAVARAKQLMQVLEDSPQTLAVVGECAACYQALAEASEVLAGEPGTEGDAQKWQEKAERARATLEQRGIGTAPRMARSYGGRNALR
jgi:eukaryotic-like serine/threonine-protein kinase